MHFTLLSCALLGASIMAGSSYACPSAKDLAHINMRSLISDNLKARTGAHLRKRSFEKVALDNVRVFNGKSLSQPRTVVIDGDLIGSDIAGAHHIDAKGATLLPGLIDSHCHPSNATDLEALTRYGVTSGFQMACFSPEMCTSLQNHTGLVNILTASASASAPGSSHGNITAAVDPSLLIHNASQIPSWVERQLAGDPDYAKLIAEVPGLSQNELNSLTKEFQRKGKMVAVHAAYFTPFQQAIAARANHIQHAPLDISINAAMAKQALKNGQTSTPTLTMMRNTAHNEPQNRTYANARDSVTLLHKTGVPILVGTDANFITGVPANVPFGSSVHDELENLVEAGLSNLEALRSATILPALHYGLYDRGSIAPGMRADLLLIDGNPLEDIKATRNILKVWVRGYEYAENKATIA